MVGGQSVKDMDEDAISLLKSNVNTPPPRSGSNVALETLSDLRVLHTGQIRPVKLISD